MKRKVLVWTGRARHVNSANDVNWEGKKVEDARVYIAAYSRTDAVRLIQEYTGVAPSTSEIRDYFDYDWGIKMKHVDPERGIWIDFNRHDRDSQAVRVI